MWGNGRWMPYLIMPVRAGVYTAAVDGDDIIVRHHGLADTNLTEVLRIRPEFFTAKAYPA